MAIGTTALAIMGLGMGLSAYGQYQEGRQRAQAEEYNADVARQQAEIVKARSKIEVLQQRKRAVSFRSTQEALYSKAGVTLSGSPLKVMEESWANAELDILMTEFDAFTQASRLQSEATQREAAAKARKTAGYTRAGTTLLSATAKFEQHFIGGGNGGWTQSPDTLLG